jgi:CRP-like cAMP-binding protein
VAEQGTRAELRARPGHFSRLWNRLVEGSDPIEELAAVPALSGLDHDVLLGLAQRLVIEQFDAGTTIYSPGDPADRVYLVSDGIVDLETGGRQVASIHSGFHFGDFDATGHSLRNTAAIARTPVVLRSLHRLAISGGVLGVLDRPAGERTLYRWLAGVGSATTEEMSALSDRIDVDAALRGLLADGTVVPAGDREGATVYRVAGSRRRAARSGGLLDTLLND